jgi:hypothetical protein
MWDYLSYYCYISGKREALARQRGGDRITLPLDGTEQYMDRCYATSAYAFFPDGQSRSLQQSEIMRKSKPTKRDYAKVRSCSLLSVSFSFSFLIRVSDSVAAGAVGSARTFGRFIS